MKIIDWCNRVIEYSFYLLFFLVPLIFTSETFELFEFNKMWLTFGIALVVAASWLTKMVVEKQIRIQRTPLDTIVLLFLLSQTISTVFSLDTHISLWGYYSRFNGGLLSTITYIFLYYAFVTNFTTNEARGDTTGKAPDPASPSFAGQAALALVERRTKSEFACLTGVDGKVGAGPRAHRDRQGPEAIIMVKRLLKISLVSGLIVALWGLPSHFGYDPTCFLFRGTFDVSCWTEAFQPKVRIFSTLGQPDWLAAYLNILLPICIAFFIIHLKNQTLADKKNNVSSIMYYVLSKKFLLPTSYFLLIALFYICLIYTDARSGFLAFWLANLVFWVLILDFRIDFKSIFKVIFERKILAWPLKFLKSFSINKAFLKYFLIFTFSFLIFTFFIGSPFHQFDKFTFPEIKKKFVKVEVKPQPKPSESGKLKERIVITESFEIRMVVWRGAIDIFRHYPIFGTGVETFAFAYYRYRPAEHNLLSEWDYLYNKAHNEYLNFLATTGIVGFGTYLSMIIFFFWLALAKVTNLFANFAKHFVMICEKSEPVSPINKLLTIALLSSYLTILITNFFGFSVVIINIYFFLIPAFVFVLQGMINPQNQLVFLKQKTGPEKISNIQWAMIVIMLFTICYLLFTLFKFWLADKAYALGVNYNKTGQYQQAYQKLAEAVSLRGNEPTFKDELSINSAILAVALMSQKDASSSGVFSSQALSLSDEVTNQHPNNVVFWKTRVRTLYTLSQINPPLLSEALEAVKKAQDLAPTDPKIAYNLGLMYQQTGDSKKAIEVLEKTIKLKPDYREAYYALGLFYHEQAIDKNGRVIDFELQQKAVEKMKYILNNLSGEDSQALQALKTWGEI